MGYGDLKADAMKFTDEIIRLVAVPVAVVMFLLAAQSTGDLMLRTRTPIQAAMIRAAQ